MHSNCLAALANMSGQFRCLHPYVSQRLVSLFETLARKYMRLEEKIKTTQTLPKPNHPPVDTKVNAEGQVSSVEKREGHPTESGEGPPGEIAPDLVSLKLFSIDLNFSTYCNLITKVFFFFNECKPLFTCVATCANFTT